MGKVLEIIVGDWKEVSAELVARTIKDIEQSQRTGTPKYFVAAAKGSSPKELYDTLIKSGFDFSGVMAFPLDCDIESSKGFDDLKKALPASIDLGNFSFIDKTEPSLINACQDYGSLIAAYGIDLAVMGLGANPTHVASNFPPTPKHIGVHLVQKVDAEGKPTGVYALTMGIGTLTSARKGILLASGEGKADAIKSTLESAENAFCPPSYLRNMDNLIVALDKGAASKLSFDALRQMYSDRKLILRYEA